MWHDVVFTERICKRKAVFAVEQGHPFGLLTEVLAHGVMLLNEHPN